MAGPRQRTYDEGGRGLAVVFAAFLSYFIGYGTMKGLGVLLTSITNDFGTDLWIIGSITSAYFSVQLLLVTVAAAVSRKVGLRCVITFGGALYGLGLIGASVSNSIIVFGIMLAIMTASGAACVMETTRAAIAFYFREKYSLAIFIVASGEPIGIMVYGPLTQILMETYGWRGTMLLFGAVGCHFIACGLLVKTPVEEYNVTSAEEEEHVTNSIDDRQLNTRKPFYKRIYSFLSKFDLDFLLDTEFILVTTSLMFYNISFEVMVVYMVPNGLFLGLSPSQASLLTMAWGVGSIIGYALTSISLQRKLSAYALVAVMGSIAVGCLAVNGLVSSFVGQIFNVAGIGMGLGSLTIVNNVLTRNMPVSDKQLVTIFCWKMTFSGVGASIGGVIAGWLYDVTGSFLASFVWCGVITAMSVLFLLAHRQYILKYRGQ